MYIYDSPDGWHEKKEGSLRVISPEAVKLEDSILDFIKAWCYQFGKHLNQLKTCFML